VDANHGFAQRAHVIKAGVAKFQAPLVHVLWDESVMAFVARGIGWVLVLFPKLNFRLDFQGVHERSPV
jgi:hypothetical protein